MKNEHMQAWIERTDIDPLIRATLKWACGNSDINILDIQDQMSSLRLGDGHAQMINTCEIQYILLDLMITHAVYLHGIKVNPEPDYAGLLSLHADIVTQINRLSSVEGDK